MNVLSLFDGISVARQALLESNICVTKYYASEIDANAIRVSKHNHSDIKHIGDVRNIISIKYDIDLLIGGSPCQDLSIAKSNREGLQGNRSSLFYEYARLLKKCKPKYFVFENVASMSQDDKNIITQELQVEPIMFDASLVSAQHRERLFWTNIKNITLPEDYNLVVKDILLKDIDTTNLLLSNKYKCNYTTRKYRSNKSGLIKIGEIYVGQAGRIYSIDGKSTTLSSNGGGGGTKTGIYMTDKDVFRILHPIECERLQSLPDNYTQGLTNNQRYKVLGNAFNCNVIKHILSFIKV